MKTSLGHRFATWNLLLFAFVLVATTGCSVKNRTQEASKGKARPLQAQIALVEQGDTAFRSNQNEVALALYDQALAVGFAKDQGEVKKGRVFIAMGQWRAALERFQEALQAAPENAEAKLLAGYAAFQSKDIATAESMLKPLSAVEPQNVAARELLGVVYNRAGKPELALPEFQAVLSLGKSSPGTYNNQGISFYMLGQYDKALDSFRKALTAGSFPRAQNNMALTLCRMKKYDDAFKAFKEARGEIAANNNLGCCLLDEGQGLKALDYFLRAIALSPRIYKPAKDNLARIEVDIQQGTQGVMEMPPATLPEDIPVAEPKGAPPAPAQGTRGLKTRTAAAAMEPKAAAISSIAPSATEGQAGQPGQQP